MKHKFESNVIQYIESISNKNQFTNLWYDGLYEVGGSRALIAYVNATDDQEVARFYVERSLKYDLIDFSDISNFSIMLEHCTYDTICEYAERFKIRHYQRTDNITNPDGIRWLADLSLTNELPEFHTITVSVNTLDELETIINKYKYSIIKVEPKAEWNKDRLDMLCFKGVVQLITIPKTIDLDIPFEQWLMCYNDRIKAYSIFWNSNYDEVRLRYNNMRIVLRSGFFTCIEKS